MNLRQLVTLLLLVLVATGGLTACSSGDETGNGAEVGVPAFTERVDTEGTVVLDVRTPEEFAAGHLPGAVNIDVQSSDFGDRIAELDKDATYAVYCRSGNRSGVAIDQMVDAGFTDAVHLAGGIGAWANEGGDVVTE